MTNQTRPLRHARVLHLQAATARATSTSHDGLFRQHLTGSISDLGTYTLFFRSVPLGLYFLMESGKPSPRTTAANLRDDLQLLNGLLS